MGEHQVRNLKDGGSSPSASTKPLSYDELVKLMRGSLKALDDVRVYFSLKKYKIKRFHKPAMDLVKACLTCHIFGAPINSRLIADLLEKDLTGSLTNVLHSLGDKHVLILKRTNKISKLRAQKRMMTLNWIINPAFLKVYRGEDIENPKDR